MARCVACLPAREEEADKKKPWIVSNLFLSESACWIATVKSGCGAMGWVHMGRGKCLYTIELIDALQRDTFDSDSGWQSDKTSMANQKIKLLAKMKHALAMTDE